MKQFKPKELNKIVKLKAFDGQECEKCHYQWYSRKENPRQCPNCKRQIKY